MVQNAGFLFGFLHGSRLGLSTAGVELYTAAKLVKLFTASDRVHVVVVSIYSPFDAPRFGPFG